MSHTMQKGMQQGMQRVTLKDERDSQVEVVVVAADRGTVVAGQ